MAGTLCSRSASAARLAKSWSAPNLLPSSMSMLACTIPLQSCYWNTTVCKLVAALLSSCKSYAP